MADRPVAERKGNHPSSSNKKYQKAQLFLTIIAGTERYEIPIYLGFRRGERFDGVAEFVRTRPEGVSIDDISKFEIRTFAVSRDTSIRDIRDLEFAGVLVREGNLFFHEDYAKETSNPSKKPRVFVVGGLHADDFHRIKDEYEAEGWVLTAFELDNDRYHWCARFVSNEGDFP